MLILNRPVDDESAVLIRLQGILRLAPGDHLGDLGVREEPEDGDVLASAARYLAAPRVDGCALDLSVVAAPEPACGLLNVGAGALEIAAVEDDGPAPQQVAIISSTSESLAPMGLSVEDASHTGPGPRR